MKQKRPIFLLEILIAMSLVTLCIAPLMKAPILMHRKEMSHLQRIEASRVAAWTFTEIVEKILKNEVRWDTLPQLGSEGPTISLAPFELKLSPLPTPSSLPRKYSIKTLEEKIVPNGPTHRLLSIRIKVGKQKFTYRINVNKSPASL